MALTREQLIATTNQLVTALTSDEMLNRMQAFRDLGPEDRFARSAQLLSVDGLKAIGVNLPEGMRLSSRYFEKGLGTVQIADQPVAPIAKMTSIDPGFVDSIRSKYPDVYVRLQNAPAELTEFGGDAKLLWGACGGAGGSAGGCGGCACGGVSK